jgi:Mg2+ and Co2+ transporter CorA
MSVERPRNAGYPSMSRSAIGLQSHYQQESARSERDSRVEWAWACSAHGPRPRSAAAIAERPAGREGLSRTKMASRLIDWGLLREQERQARTARSRCRGPNRPYVEGRPGERRVVTAYLFDQRRGQAIGSWSDSIAGLGESEVLWLDLEDGSEDEEREVREALGLGDDRLLVPGDPVVKARLEQYESYLRVTVVGVSDAESDPEQETVVVDCFVGLNWVVTAHRTGIAALDDFGRSPRGRGRSGSSMRHRSSPQCSSGW